MARNKLLTAFGQEVRRRRQALGLTLEAFAERAELTPNFIGGVENGRRNPSTVTSLAIARGLGVPIGELLGGHEGLSPEGLEGGRLLEALPPKARVAVLAMLRGLAEA